MIVSSPPLLVPPGSVATRIPGILPLDVSSVPLHIPETLRDALLHAAGLPTGVITITPPAPVVVKQEPVEVIEISEDESDADRLGDPLPPPVGKKRGGTIMTVGLRLLRC